MHKFLLTLVMLLILAVTTIAGNPDCPPAIIAQHNAIKKAVTQSIGFPANAQIIGQKQDRYYLVQTSIGIYAVAYQYSQSEYQVIVPTLVQKFTIPRNYTADDYIKECGYELTNCN